MVNSFAHRYVLIPENIYRLWTYQDASSKTSKEYSTRSCVNDLAGGMQLNVNKFLGNNSLFHEMQFSSRNDQHHVKN